MTKDKNTAAANNWKERAAMEKNRGGVESTLFRNGSKNPTLP